MGQFMGTILLFIVLGAFTVGKVTNIYLVLFSLLFILSTIRSLYEEDNVIAIIIQFTISTILTFITKEYILFLLFYPCFPDRFRDKSYKIFVPSVAYLIFELTINKANFPIILLNTLFLIGFSILIFILETIAMKYVYTEDKISEAIKKTAIAELYQKKINKELVVKNYLIDRNARLEEREKISVNIHNSVGHTITAAILTLDAADVLYDVNPEEARKKMSLANKRIHSSLEHIRHAVRVLDNDTRDIEIKDFIFMLEEVFKNFSMDTPIRINNNFKDISNNISIPREHGEFLTGAVGEALSNGVRHGNADLFTVILILDSSNFKISILDNGKNDFTENNKITRMDNGFGLKKISNYLFNSGGSMEIKNKNGFKITMTLPLLKQ